MEKTFNMLKEYNNSMKAKGLNEGNSINLNNKIKDMEESYKNIHYKDVALFKRQIENSRILTELTTLNKK